LLFIQVCSDPAQMLCSKVQGKMQSPLFSALYVSIASHGIGSSSRGRIDSSNSNAAAAL